MPEEESRPEEEGDGEPLPPQPNATAMTSTQQPQSRSRSPHKAASSRQSRAKSTSHSTNTNQDDSEEKRAKLHGYLVPTPAPFPHTGQYQLYDYDEVHDFFFLIYTRLMMCTGGYWYSSVYGSKRQIRHQGRYHHGKHPALYSTLTLLHSGSCLTTWMDKQPIACINTTTATASPRRTQVHSHQSTGDL